MTRAQRTRLNQLIVVPGVVPLCLRCAQAEVLAQCRQIGSAKTKVVEAQRDRLEMALGSMDVRRTMMAVARESATCTKLW